MPAFHYGVDTPYTPAAALERVALRYIRSICSSVCIWAVVAPPSLRNCPRLFDDDAVQGYMGRNLVDLLVVAYGRILS